MDRTIKATQSAMPRMEEYFKEISTIWDSGIMTNNGALAGGE